MVIDQIKNFLQTSPDFCGRVPENLGIEHRLIETGILDSFDIISLVAFLEDMFSIHVEGGELIPENFETLETLERYVKRKLNQG